MEFKVRVTDVDQITENFDYRGSGEERKIFKPGVTHLNLKIWKMTPTVMFRKANI